MRRLLREVGCERWRGQLDVKDVEECWMGKILTKAGHERWYGKLDVKDGMESWM